MFKNDYKNVLVCIGKFNNMVSFIQISLKSIFLPVVNHNGIGASDCYKMTPVIGSHGLFLL